jgi:FkbM family methyltransferase
VELEGGPPMRFHPVYQLRQHAAGRFLLRQLEGETWMRPKRLAFPIRGRRIQHFRMARNYEPAIGEVFTRILRERDIKCFWDVGANIGFYSFLVKTAQPHTQVEAFEPDAQNAALMRNTIEHNGIRGIVVNELALSDSVGVAQFSFDDVSGLTGCVSESDRYSLAHTRYGCTRHDSVRTSTVDAIRSLRDHPVSLLKIDVEGHEVRVVEGALQTLADDKPAVVVECLTETYLEVARLFGSVGYTISSIDGFHYLADHRLSPSYLR